MNKVGWKCPNCGAILGRPPYPPGGPFGRVSGTVRCAGCHSAFSVADVYGGKYDVGVSRHPKRKAQDFSGKRKDELLNVPGIGETIAGELRATGITSIRALRATDPEKLARIPGLGPKTAKKIIRAAKNMKARKGVISSGGISPIEAIQRVFSHLFSHTPRCRDCYWYADAELDGVRNKGICNYGTGQRPPFTMSPGMGVKIAWGRKAACEHFKKISLDITY